MPRSRPVDWLVVVVVDHTWALAFQLLVSNICSIGVAGLSGCKIKPSLRTACSTSVLFVLPALSAIPTGPVLSVAITAFSSQLLPGFADTGHGLLVDTWLCGRDVLTRKYVLKEATNCDVERSQCNGRVHAELQPPCSPEIVFRRPQPQCKCQQGRATDIEVS